MGRVAPAPTVEPFQSGTSKPSMLPKRNPLSAGSFSFSSSLHKNENNEFDSKQETCLKGEETKSPQSSENDSTTESYNTGRWGGSEKRLFLEGLRRYGKGRWKQIGKVVKTRSLVQIKSHGQKVLKKLETGEDIFAELDNDNDSTASMGNDGKQELNGREGASNNIFNKFAPSYATEESEDVGSPKTPSSRFAWILPARSQTKEQEKEIVSNAYSPKIPGCKGLTPPRKRKGRKKEPKAKIARTDLSMESAGSFMDETISESSTHSSDIQQDTAVAVQALSTLFLSTQPITSNLQADRPMHEESNTQGKISSSRVEDAHILLSLMGRRSRDEEETHTAKNSNLSESQSPPTLSWWPQNLRRKS